MYEVLVVLAFGLLHTVIHEVGHILAALAVGSQIKQIGLDKRGPFIRRAPASTPQRNAIVVLAGPGINIFTWFVLLSFRNPHAWVALFIGVFNLLPLPGSDLIQCFRYLGIKFAYNERFSASATRPDR